MAVAVAGHGCLLHAEVPLATGEDAPVAVNEVVEMHGHRRGGPGLLGECEREARSASIVGDVVRRE